MCYICVIPPNSKLGEKKCKKIYLLLVDWHINLPRFQGARPDHVRVQSSSSCFPRELVSRELGHPNQGHV